MANISLYTKCAQCGGNGIRSLPSGSIPPVIINTPCLDCGGTGYLGLSELDSELLNDMSDKIGDILDKCNDIFEKVNI